MGSHYRHNGWFRNTLLACSVLIISSFASVSFGDVIPAKKSAWEHWEQLEIRQAPWRPIGGSLELTGGKWTNGKNDGNMIWSRDRFDHRGKDVFIRFKVEDGGAYMGIWTHPRPLPMPIYTTRNTHQGSILIEENTWYFQRTRVDANGYGLHVRLLDGEQNAWERASEKACGFVEVVADAQPKNLACWISRLQERYEAISRK